MANENSSKQRSVSVEHPAYIAMKGKWKRARAILGGQDAAKLHDKVLDNVNLTNLLIPFSTQMTQVQYNFYLAEAELPGISSQFFKILVGTLMKTTPEVICSDKVTDEAKNWINSNIGNDGSSLGLFMRGCLEEELTSSRAWVFVDRPPMPEDLDKASALDDKYRPYPVLWLAEEIINWKKGLNTEGKEVPVRVVLKQSEEIPNPDNEFDTLKVDVFVVHELDAEGFYQVRIFKRNKNQEFEIKTISDIFFNGERLREIPAWPINGQYEPAEPALITFINKEIGLYNKLSRRNHLLYGAATYTPYVKSEMSPDDFQKIVDSGLGSWFKIGREDDAGVLEAPTGALQDYDRAIAATMDELAKLGIRIMTPEVSQSGVALEIRNAAQTSQVGFLAELLSIVFSKVIVFMLNWRYDLKLRDADVTVKVNNNFLRQAVSIQWAELVTQWYENNLIPRSLWLSIVKSSELLPADYDDGHGQKEIADSPNQNNLDNPTDSPESALNKLLNKGR
jgi:hypothetical protein